MSDAWDISVLKDYDISEQTGFLPPKILSELPEYFRSWSDLAKNVSEHLKRHEVRKLVDEMPLLEDYLDHLSEDEEERIQQLRLAHVFLTFIATTYVRQEGEINDVKKVIPEQLAIPWHGISQKLGFKPVPTFSSMILYNYKPKDPNKPLCLENFDVICEIPGARWFFQVNLQIEVDAVKGIKAIVKAKKAAAEGNNDALKKAIGEIVESLGNIKKTALRMKEHLTGSVFHNDIRPFLSGYGPGTSISEGLIFEGISREALAAINGSAAQSSAIPSFDAALGVEHPEVVNVPGSENGELPSSDHPREIAMRRHLDVVREYMPPKHAKFIEDLATKPPFIKEYVRESGDEDLKEVYRSAVQALRSFRDVHLGLVTRYAVKPAAEAGIDMGTGGADLLTFLMGLRDSTKKAAEQF